MNTADTTENTEKKTSALPAKKSLRFRDTSAACGHSSGYQRFRAPVRRKTVGVDR